MFYDLASRVGSCIPENWLQKGSMDAAHKHALDVTVGYLSTLHANKTMVGLSRLLGACRASVASPEGCKKNSTPAHPGVWRM